MQSWWYDYESVEAVLARANQFLRDPDAEHNLNAVSILDLVVKTRSYVRFLRMHRLAEVIFFGGLQVVKLEVAQGGGAAAGGGDELHGFCSFASSTGQVLSLTHADEPAHSTTVVEGLRFLSHLEAYELDMWSPFKVGSAFLTGTAPTKWHSEEKDAAGGRAASGLAWTRPQHLLGAQERGEEAEAIHSACSDGNLELVKKLAKQNELSLTALDECGRQPIHEACCKGHLDVAL